MKCLKFFLASLPFIFSLGLQSEEPKNALTPAKTDEKRSFEELYISMQPYVVSIESRTSDAAISTPGTSYGTGFIFNKEKGIILTNAHVATPDGVINRYDITLHDGTVCRAKLYYADPWHDFALLKVDPKDLDKIPQKVVIKKGAIAVGEPVMIIGKNANKHFSIQTGTIANPCETTSTQLPGESFRISLNAQGGASGSPIINSKGEIIGLLYASDHVTSAYAMKIDYALDALSQLEASKTPKRLATGVILTLTSLDTLTRHDQFDQSLSKTLSEKYPEAFNRVLTVHAVLAGSPAAQYFESGDVILKVNNKEVGPSLYLVDKIINESDFKKSVEFHIIRHGKEMNFKVPVYSLYDKVIQRMIQFGNAIFYELNDHVRQKTGATSGVFITNLKLGGPFIDVLPSLGGSNGVNKGLISVTNLNGTAIKTLDDVKKIIPSLMKKTDFYIKFKNYAAELVYNNEYSFAQQEQIRYLSFYETDEPPLEFKFDTKKMEWAVERIQSAK